MTSILHAGRTVSPVPMKVISPVLTRSGLTPALLQALEKSNTLHLGQKSCWAEENRPPLPARTCRLSSSLNNLPTFLEDSGEGSSRWLLSQGYFWSPTSDVTGSVVSLPPVPRYYIVCSLSSGDITSPLMIQSPKQEKMPGQHSMLSGRHVLHAPGDVAARPAERTSPTHSRGILGIVVPP